MKNLKKLDLAAANGVETLRNSDNDNFDMLKAEELEEILGGYYCSDGYIPGKGYCPQVYLDF